MPSIKGKLLLSYSVLILILSTFTFVVYQITKFKKSSKIAFLNESVLDVHKFILSCENNKHNYILFLSLDCDHCSDAISFIRKQKSQLTKESSFVLVFNEKEAEIKKFITSNIDWIKTDGIAIYNDDDRQLFSMLNVTFYPTLFEVNSNQIICFGNGVTGLKKILNEK